MNWGKSLTSSIWYHIMACHVMSWSPRSFFVLVSRSFVDSFLWLMGYHTSVWNLYHHFYFLLRNVTFTDSRRRLTFFWERLLINFCVIYTFNLFLFEITYFSEEFFCGFGTTSSFGFHKIKFFVKIQQRSFKKTEYWIFSSSTLEFPEYSSMWEHFFLRVWELMWHESDLERYQL